MAAADYPFEKKYLCPQNSFGCSLDMIEAFHRLKHKTGITNSIAVPGIHTFSLSRKKRKDKNFTMHFSCD